MMGRHTSLCAEQGGLLLAGLAGLATAAFIACNGDAGDAGDSGDGDGANQTASTAGSAAAGSGGVGGSAAGSGGAGGAATGARAGCELSPATAENTADVVAATNALLEALTPQQRSAIQYDLTLSKAQVWSNFPVTFVARNGVKLSDMSNEAAMAAKTLAEMAAGATGYKLYEELRAADQFLVTDGKASSTDYGDGLYYFAVYGKPSTSSAWMLQLAGHHLAYNFTYGGKCTSATPLFDGVEPTDWTDTAGAAHKPLEAQRASMVNLLASLADRSDAVLSGTFGDLVNGPAGGGPGMNGGGDTKYPTSLSYPTGTAGRGAAVSSLSAQQKTLVKAAMEAWVKNVADPVSAALLAAYESDDALGHTYVGYSGSADLTTQGSYARIDGPRVWIEVTVQGGIVYRNKVHYHTIWRDKVADYGAEFLSE
jgi:hypothetical protein